MRRQLIDQVGQVLAQSSKEILVTNAGLLAQGSEGITAEGTCQVIGRDLLVGTSADP